MMSCALLILGGAVRRQQIANYLSRVCLLPRFLPKRWGNSRSSPLPDREADEWLKALERAGGVSLRTYVRRITHSAEATEDILQDTYERYLRHVGAGKPASHEWLRKVAFHLSLNHLRQLKRTAETVPAEEAPELVTASTVVEGEAERWESVVRLFGVVSTLAPEEQHLIDLHYWREMSIREIAAEWGKSVEAVQKRLTRTLKRLRTELSLKEP